MKVTIKDIANEAGVAYSTVSRIVNGTGNFSQETIDKVENIIRETGYVKNQNASDLVVKRNSNVIGLVMPLHHTNFTDNVINGIHEQLIANHYELLITYAESYNESDQYKAVTTLIERGVAGIVILSMNPFESVKKVLSNQKVIFVVLGMHIDDNQITSFDFDEYQIGYDATDFLIKRGHTNIAFIGLELNENNITSIRRFQGYKDALANNNIKFNNNFILPGNFSFEDGISSKSLLNLKEHPSAFIGASDLVSIGILKMLAEKKLSVPKDFSLISIDGTELTKYMNPTLTAIKLPFKKLGNIGIEQLINQIDGKGNPDAKELEASVVDGESVQYI